MTVPKKQIKTRVPKLTPSQLRLVMLREEAKNKRKDAKKLEHILSTSTTKVHNLVQEKDLNLIPAQIREDVLSEDVEIVFRPNPGPQTEFLAATEKEVFYGGSRGGGKSYSLLIDPLRYCDKESARALLLRRTMPELRDLINHSHRLYPKAFPGARWREQEKEWRFPSGARIEFGYAETEQDSLRYQGQAYTWIGVDELPQFPTPDVWNHLKGSLRSVDPSIPEYMRATGNPGNTGSLWVKEMFIDPAEPGEAFYAPIDPLDESKGSISRKFIQAKLKDNPYLTQTKSYESMLLSLPEVKRKQWLEGDWSAFEGAAFAEFDHDLHVIQPFDIPPNWPRWRSCDWGFSSPFCVLWMASDYDENVYVYREFYGKGLTADIFARRVRELEAREFVQYGVMDSSVWSRRGDVGPAIPEIMRMHGCIWRPSDRSSGSRHSGKMEIHRRLRVIDGPDGEKTVRLKIFNTCKNLIKTLPMLPTDANDSEDVDTKSLDHAYDALRYGLMSRPMDANRFEYQRQLQREEFWRPSNKVGY